MTAEPRKSPRKESVPLPLRSMGFGVMFILWWIFTFELPARNLTKIFEARVGVRGVETTFVPLTVWVHEVATWFVNLRLGALVVILIMTLIHFYLWKRHPGYDVYGKWLFKAAFLVFYILMYGFFILMFIGAELPVWSLSTDLPTPVEQP